jgi:hypothetical protein
MAIIRGTQLSGGDSVPLKATEVGTLVTIDQRIVWTAKGYGYEAMATTAVASLIVRPSTLSQLTLYNNTTDKHFVIERAFAHNLVSIANGQFGIWLCVHPTGMAIPAGNNITIRNSLSGKAANTTVGVVDTAETVVDDGWFPWGENSTSVTATVPGSLAQALVHGTIIIPPTAGISIQSVAQTAVVTTCCGFHWFAVPESELAVN